MPHALEAEDSKATEPIPEEIMMQDLSQSNVPASASLGGLPVEMLTLIGRALFSSYGIPTADFFAFRLTSHAVAEATLFPLVQSLRGVLSPSRSNRDKPEEQLRLILGASRLVQKADHLIMTCSPFSLKPMGKKLSELRLPNLRCLDLQQLCFDDNLDSLMGFLETHHHTLNRISITDCVLVVRAGIPLLELQLRQSCLQASRYCSDECTPSTMLRITRMLWLPLLLCLHNMPDTRLARPMSGSIKMNGLKCHFTSLGWQSGLDEAEVTHDMYWNVTSARVCPCLALQSAGRDFRAIGQRPWVCRHKFSVTFFLEEHVEGLVAEAESEDS